MGRNLEQLNEILFDQLEKLQNDSMTDDELEREIKKAESVTKIANTVINNGRLALDVIKSREEYGGGQDGFLLGE